MEMVKIEIQKLFASEKIQQLFTNSLKDQSEVQNLNEHQENKFQKLINNDHQKRPWSQTKNNIDFPANNPSQSIRIPPVFPQFSKYIQPVEMPPQNIGHINPYYGYIPQQMSFGNYSNTNIFNNYNSQGYNTCLLYTSPSPRDS